MATHRELCKTMASWLLDQPGIDLVSWELKYVRGVYDVIGLTSRPTAKTKKLVAIEVKRTRSDLLGDLRRRKMLKYETRATHCYLAATPEALRAHALTSREVLSDLTTKGLPKHWGVILIQESGPIVLRKSIRHKKIQTQTIYKLTRKIARSFMYRVMSDTSPMRESDANSSNRRRNGA